MIFNSFTHSQLFWAHTIPGTRAHTGASAGHQTEPSSQPSLAKLLLALKSLQGLLIKAGVGASASHSHNILTVCSLTATSNLCCSCCWEQVTRCCLSSRKATAPGWCEFKAVRGVTPSLVSPPFSTAQLAHRAQALQQVLRSGTSACAKGQVTQGATFMCLCRTQTWRSVPISLGAGYRVPLRYFSCLDLHCRVSVTAMSC